MAKELATPNLQTVELAILGEGEYTASVEDAEQIGKEIVYRIMSAESEDELFTQSATLSAKDLLGVPLLIKNVRWNTSRYGDEGPKVFAIIEAERMDNGDRELITCGSRNVMAQLLRAGQMGKLPMEVPLKFQENETASGYGALWLTKA
jgi:hypothetical protein